jgi:hypothetical protein
MDAKSDLLKEAIADAKAVKETALANAKIALEEAFAPRIQSMLSTKLAEELDEEEEDLAAAAAEMSAAEVEPAPAEPAPEMEAEPMIDGGEAEISMDAPAEEEALDIDMSEGDYSIEEEDSSVAEDLELEAIIRELEEDLNEEDLTEEEIHEEEINEEDAVDAAAEDDLTTEELNIDEIIESILSEEDDMPTEGRMMKDEDEDPSDDHSNPKEGRGDKKVEEALEGELAEAYDTIESLRDTINEVNLLNAKLLYTNKLFRNFELSEDQKMKVIENFDRAGTTREVKLVFTTLAENFTVPTKKRKVVKEGAASKPAGTTTAPTKQIINEGNELANRWKKLAGLLD